MMGIQKTIAICIQWMPRDFPTIESAVDYAKHVYLDPHRNTIRLFEKYIKVANNTY
jgi:hypothetical protein